MTLLTTAPWHSLGKLMLPVSATLGSADLYIKLPREGELPPGDTSCHFVILCSLLQRDQHGRGHRFYQQDELGLLLHTGARNNTFDIQVITEASLHLPLINFDGKSTNVSAMI